ncbi:hypothetical protein BFP72_17100 [Reichenbachiella sp. 5M10]|nr:hypothetical protein BFP72_17100 [Reichenbachiella sp. 5M10]
MYACTPRPTDPEDTPAVLQESSTKRSLTDLSYTYREDIIDRLFDEAVNEDPKLESLVGALGSMDKVSWDSLDAYRSYTQTNEQYWSSFKEYVSQFNDSTWERPMHLLLDSLQEIQRQRMAQHTSAEEHIQENQKRLADQVVLLKVWVTQSMMQRYQQNELPDLATLKAIQERYDSLIREVEAIHKLSQ